jgi:hypothetical protein
VEQTRANQLALEDLEDGAGLGQRRADAVDVVAEPLFEVAVDAQRAEVGPRERVDVDREPEAVLAPVIGAADLAARVRRRERRLLEAERAQVVARLVE